MRNYELALFLCSFLLGSLSTAVLALLVAEIRWRDPRFQGLHKPLNLINFIPRKGN